MSSPWTDADVERAAEVLHTRFCPYTNAGCVVADRYYAAHTHAVLDALAPRVAELQRAAKVEALRYEAGLWERTAPLTDLPVDAAYVGQALSRRADEIERGA